MSGNAWFMHKLRVRYQETDTMQVVYHANYLNWFEIGRTEWVRGKGLSYRQLELEGLKLPVLKVEMNFKRPALYDDIIRVYTRAEKMTDTRIEFEVEIRRFENDELGVNVCDTLKEEQAEPEGELLVIGRTHHAWLDRDWKPLRLSRVFPQVWAKLKG